MKKNVLLFINGELGLDVLEHITNDQDSKILGAVINSEKKSTSGYRLKIDELQIRRHLDFPIFTFDKLLWSSTSFNSILNQTNLAVVALFGHLIPPDIISRLSPNIVNLHPSLLPIGRGADPVAWGIMEQKKQGATIHVVEETLDTGPIIYQTEIPSNFGMSAGQIYSVATLELLNLFKKFYETWPQTPSPRAQVGPHTFHITSELEDLRKRFMNNSSGAEHVLRAVQALSFNDGRAIRIKMENGELWEVRLNAKLVE